MSAKSNERHLFGTDGIRGVANQKLTPELTLKLAMAAGQVLERPGNERPVVLIGKDTRQSGDMLESALAAGFASVGWDVELLGVVPTPAVAWLVKHRGAGMGAMISASHNPAPDNGIKLFAHTGYKLPDAVELEIEKALAEGPGERLSGAGVGRIRNLPACHREPYLAALLETELAPLKGLRLAVDLAHGAMSEIAPELLQRLDLELHSLNGAPDGLNINAGCGSTHLGPLKRYVQANGLDLGIAFDGDGDRCLAVGPNGEEIDGDRILYLCARYLPALSQEQAVVATVMSNLGLEQALEKIGKRLLRTGVGDRYVLETMQTEGHALGGEQSGHVIFAPWQVTGDGLLTALQLLNAVARSGRPVPELLQDVPQYPQLLKNVVVHPGWHHSWQTHPGLKSALARAEAKLEGTGRLLVRASGTEPKIRVMAEGQDPALVQDVVESLADLIQQEMGV
ncbi:MAG: phosphoglucosamine mutase [Candidatus Sericytochromatia bacterium]